MLHKEIKKRTGLDKELINKWIDCLCDMCKGNAELIRRKLICCLQDRFIWSKEIADYVNQQVNNIYRGEYYG